MFRYALRASGAGAVLFLAFSGSAFVAEAAVFRRRCTPEVWGRHIRDGMVCVSSFVGLVGAVAETRSAFRLSWRFVSGIVRRFFFRSMAIICFFNSVLVLLLKADVGTDYCFEQVSVS